MGGKEKLLLNWIVELFFSVTLETVQSDFFFMISEPVDSVGLPIGGRRLHLSGDGGRVKLTLSLFTSWQQLPV